MALHMVDDVRGEGELRVGCSSVSGTGGGKGVFEFLAFGEAANSIFGKARSQCGLARVAKGAVDTGGKRFLLWISRGVIDCTIGCFLCSMAIS